MSSGGIKWEMKDILTEMSRHADNVYDAEAVCGRRVDSLTFPGKLPRLGAHHLFLTILAHNQYSLWSSCGRRRLYTMSKPYQLTPEQLALAEERRLKKLLRKDNVEKVPVVRTQGEILPRDWLTFLPSPDPLRTVKIMSWNVCGLWSFSLIWTISEC